jgi:hypothetical protein
MPRKRLSEALQTSVLRRSRRRCCVCFGLNRDTSIKQGQIAHLDHNAENDEEDNLAFLCLTCHDRYDSNSSQSKNFTIAEVKAFRLELQEAISAAFAQSIQFGDAKSPRPGISGQYIRTGAGTDSAELMVHELPEGRVRIVGEALWGTNREYGPNIGTLDFIAELRDTTAEFEDKPSWSDVPYRIKLSFSQAGMQVVEQLSPGYFGMNVTFGGSYIKAT